LVAKDKLCGRATVFGSTVAEIRNKIKETCSIHEMRITKPITDKTAQCVKKPTNYNNTNGKLSTFATIFQHTTAAKDENYDNSNEYNVAFPSLAHSTISS
jgi:hypothetical protein